MTRPLYKDDSVKLTRDLLTNVNEGITITASTFASVDSNFTIQIPMNLSAHGGLDVQANNSNYIDSTLTGTVKYVINPAMNQPSMGTRRNVSLNPSFSANWVTIGTLTSGTVFKAFSNTPVRFIRLFGVGLTAAGFAAYIWSDKNSDGN